MKKYCLVFLFIVFVGIGICLSIFECKSTQQRTAHQALSQITHYVLQPRWDDALNFEDIEYHLKNDAIASCIPIADYFKQRGQKYDFDNTVVLVTLESGLKAVFKEGEDCYGEVAAYRASIFLRLRLVPPTVLRSLNGVMGSLQFFIEASIDHCAVKSNEEYWKDIDEKTISDVKLFYFVFGQWDINPTNQIIQINEGKKYIALIDNAGLCNQSKIQYGDFTFVRRGYSNQRNDSCDDPFSFDKLLQLNNPTCEEIEAIFGEFLPQQAIQKMWSRFKRICYVIWRNSLWIQYYKDNALVIPQYTACYYQSTLAACIQLSREVLENIWAEALLVDRQYYQALIDLTLERKEMIMEAAKKGIIK